MEDNVSFKVFLKNKEEQEVRRFVIDKNVSTSFDYLVSKLRVIFPQIQGSVFTVGWTDDDGDQVTITSDEELIIALTEMAGPLYKLRVTVKKPVQAPTEGGEEVVVHHGVTCDGCEVSNITGPRYKCVVCDDYDLCGSFEAAGRHPGHNMMKITLFPHRLFKRIQRLQEKAEKKTGGANEKWNEKLEKDMKQVEEQLKNIPLNIPQCGFSAGPSERRDTNDSQENSKVERESKYEKVLRHKGLTPFISMDDFKLPMNEFTCELNNQRYRGMTEEQQTIAIEIRKRWRNMIAAQKSRKKVNDKLAQPQRYKKN